MLAYTLLPLNEENHKGVHDLLARLIPPGKREPTWPLPNQVPSTEAEFWGFNTTWIPTACVYVGSVTLEPSRWAALVLYVVNHSQLIDGGFAVAYEYGREKTHYYKWTLCKHEFTSRNIGRCLNEYTCKHCGKSYQIDSSD